MALSIQVCGGRYRRTTSNFFQGFFWGGFWVFFGEVSGFFAGVQNSLRQHTLQKTSSFRVSSPWQYGTGNPPPLDNSNAESLNPS